MGRGRQGQDVFCGVKGKGGHLLDTCIQQIFMEHQLCADTSSSAAVCISLLLTPCSLCQQWPCPAASALPAGGGAHSS